MIVAGNMAADQMTLLYQRIVYPERAEYLKEVAFSGYRIFLDHWTEITNYLKESFEVLKVRRYSKALIIYGKQGCGKSVLADKLLGDYQRSKAASKQQMLAFDADNIWHRITSGASADHYVDNIRSATDGTVILGVESNIEWVNKAAELVAGNSDRLCLVVADNCERDYFLQDCSMFRRKRTWPMAGPTKPSGTQRIDSSNYPGRRCGAASSSSSQITTISH